MCSTDDEGIPSPVESEALRGFIFFHAEVRIRCWCGAAHGDQCKYSTATHYLVGPYFSPRQLRASNQRMRLDRCYMLIFQSIPAPDIFAILNHCTFNTRGGSPTHNLQTLKQTWRLGPWLFLALVLALALSRLVFVRHQS
ncbi:hypothetical protein BDW42DRAFT_126938 [Aspergillus taichungensis]|uniref:Uncharacterized protein n=1 Tax=Aspergillus taichungensis TaxID=482145 RepID=A0A2J5HQQ0_9EURO|nr:hypothetical protein BDW42DRAFT_126938 [Aspergillus taichungensis]